VFWAGTSAIILEVGVVVRRQPGGGRRPAAWPGGRRHRPPPASAVDALHDAGQRRDPSRPPAVLLHPVVAALVLGNLAIVAISVVQLVG
jgi:hypothetical protein